MELTELLDTLSIHKIKAPSHQHRKSVNHFVHNTIIDRDWPYYNIAMANCAGVVMGICILRPDMNWSGLYLQDHHQSIHPPATVHLKV